MNARELLQRLIAGPVSWNLLIHVGELPPAEPHTVFAEWHHEAIGGTSAGKALNLARLGVPVTLVTVVGDDEPVVDRVYRYVEIDAAAADIGTPLMATGTWFLNVSSTRASPSGARDGSEARSRCGATC